MEEKGEGERLQCCKHFPRDQGYYPSLFDKQSQLEAFTCKLSLQRAHCVATVLGKLGGRQKGRKEKTLDL